MKEKSQRRGQHNLKLATYHGGKKLKSGGVGEERRLVAHTRLVTRAGLAQASRTNSTKARLLERSPAAPAAINARWDSNWRIRTAPATGELRNNSPAPQPQAVTKSRRSPFLSCGHRHSFSWPSSFYLAQLLSPGSASFPWLRLFFRDHQGDNPTGPDSRGQGARQDLRPHQRRALRCSQATGAVKSPPGPARPGPAGTALHRALRPRRAARFSARGGGNARGRPLVAFRGAPSFLSTL